MFSVFSVLQFLRRLWAPQLGHVLSVLLQTEQEAKGRTLRRTRRHQLCNISRDFHMKGFYAVACDYRTQIRE